MRCLACLIAILLCAQGCGIKGALYIETPEQKRKAEERRERREAAKQRDAQQGASQVTPREAVQPPAASAAPSTGERESEPPAASDFNVTDESFGPSPPPQ
jgi:predicted small lipoprotein YifL